MNKPRLFLFDIGSTLWSSPEEDPGALAACYGRGRDILVASLGDAPPIEALIDAVEGYFAEWEEIWRQDSGQVLQSPTSQFVAEALAKLNLSPPAAALQSFTDAILETSIFTAKTLGEEPGMKEALAGLKQIGLRLGCVSNAFMSAAVLDRIMDERGLGPYLEYTVSSCDLGYRKPHPAIYRAAGDFLGIPANETVFVGDRLDADVAGPAQLGMRTVLTQQYRAEDPDIYPVKPDFVIAHLSELVAVARSLVEP